MLTLYGHGYDTVSQILNIYFLIFIMILHYCVIYNQIKVKISI